MLQGHRHDDPGTVEPRLVCSRPANMKTSNTLKTLNRQGTRKMSNIQTPDEHCSLSHYGLPKIVTITMMELVHTEPNFSKMAMCIDMTCIKSSEEMQSSDCQGWWWLQVPPFTVLKILLGVQAPWSSRVWLRGNNEGHQKKKISKLFYGHKDWHCSRAIP